MGGRGAGRLMRGGLAAGPVGMQTAEGDSAEVFCSGGRACLQLGGEQLKGEVWRPCGVGPVAWGTCLQLAAWDWGNGLMVRRAVWGSTTVRA